MSPEHHPEGVVLLLPEVAPRLLAESAAWRAGLVAALNAVLTEAKWVVSVDIEEDVMELVRRRFLGFGLG